MIRDCLLHSQTSRSALRRRGDILHRLSLVVKRPLTHTHTYAHCNQILNHANVNTLRTNHFLLHIYPPLPSLPNLLSPLLLSFPLPLAGVVALLLQVDPLLTSREIAHILVDTAKRPSHVTWEENGAHLLVHPQVCMCVRDPVWLCSCVSVWIYELNGECR